MIKMRKTHIFKYVFAAALLVCLSMLLRMSGTSLSVIQAHSAANVNTFTAPADLSEPESEEEAGGSGTDAADSADEGSGTDSDAGESGSSADSDESQTADTAGVRTGDKANTVLWVCLAAASAAAAGILLRRMYRVWTGRAR